MSRPFGVAMLFAGVDQDGPRLYVILFFHTLNINITFQCRFNPFRFRFHLDPSGTFIDCLAKSIGAASDGAEQSLKELYFEVFFQKFWIDFISHIDF